jgi:hypothetical protein
MRRIILSSMADVVKFKSLVEDKVDHYCGIHTNCPDKEFCSKIKDSIRDPGARKAFLVSILLF